LSKVSKFSFFYALIGFFIQGSDVRMKNNHFVMRGDF